MSAYYNEIDAKKAAWLRELIAAGEIAPGDVDERSVCDVRPEDLRGYSQCHWFAGVGVWSYALRLAGWDDSRPVWTGSCPCPSFSVAGKGEGFSDPRHLWPDWYRLIRESKPPAVFGEQSDAAIGHGWLDLVQTDVEAEDYALGKAVLGACSVGAPHRRQRLYFVADNSSARLERSARPSVSGIGNGLASSSSSSSSVADSNGTGLPLCERETVFGARRRDEGRAALQRGGASCSMAAADGRQSRNGDIQRSGEYRLQPQEGGTRGVADAVLPERRPVDGYGEDGRVGRNGGRQEARSEPGARGEVLVMDYDGRPGPVNGFWRDADWIFCTDGKWRAVRPGSQPLATGAPARVGRLRGYGDAITAQVAAAFISAYMETVNGR